MSTMEVPLMDQRTRWLFAVLGLAILTLFLGGLGYVGTRSVETITLALAFFGGMSMVLTP